MISKEDLWLCAVLSSENSIQVWLFKFLLKLKRIINKLKKNQKHFNQFQDKFLNTLSHSLITTESNLIAEIKSITISFWIYCPIWPNFIMKENLEILIWVTQIKSFLLPWVFNAKMLKISANKFQNSILEMFWLCSKKLWSNSQKYVKKSMK